MREKGKNEEEHNSGKTQPRDFILQTLLCTYAECCSTRHFGPLVGQSVVMSSGFFFSKGLSGYQALLNINALIPAQPHGFILTHQCTVIVVMKLARTCFLVACTQLYNPLCPSVRPSVIFILLFFTLGPHCSCPNALVTFNMAPAHLHRLR